MPLLHRLLAVVRARRMEAELAEEMETHRALAEAALRDGGLPPGDALAESRRRMGNTTLAREDARAVWRLAWLDMLRQDTGYALRVLRRSPAFAASMIVVLGVGIGATTSVFGLLDALAMRDLPVREPARLVYFGSPSFSYPLFREVSARSGAVLAEVAAWDLDQQYVGWTGELEPTDVLSASGNFYGMLGVAAAAGRTFTTADDRIGGGPDGRVAVISHAAWQRRFGASPSAIGRTIRIDRESYTIVGVTPPGFFGVAPGLAPEITIPLTSNQDKPALASTSSSSVHMLARLQEGVTIPEANAALGTFWPAALAATTNERMSPERRAMYLGRTTTLEAGHAGFSRIRNRFARPLWLLFGLVGVLLAVACASAANLLLARGAARRRETAVRLALGASRGRLVRQMLTESVIWTAIAAAAGLLFALWGAAKLVTMMSTSQQAIALDVAIDWRLLGFAVALTLLTAAVCSVVPALRATRIDLNNALKTTTVAGGRRRRWWSIDEWLVASQVALTVVLLCSAAVFVRSLARVLGEDAGFVRDNVLVLSTDAEAAGYEGERLEAFHAAWLERLAQLPGVRGASLSMYPPLSDSDGAWTQSVSIDGQPVPARPGESTVYFNTVSPGYFQTVGVAMRAGRDFTAADVADAPRVVVVSETLARRYFPGQDAIGRRITIGRAASRQDLEIVGIAADAKYQRLQEDARAVGYLPYRQHPSGNLFAELRVSAPGAQTADTLRAELRRIDPAVPLRVQSVDDRIRESLVRERVAAALASALGLAALVLACAAVYGLFAYAVARQTREIGVRLALGAEPSAVLRAVLARSALLAVAGIAAGLGAALALGRAAGDVLYRVSPSDPASFIAAAMVMAVVALVSAYLPARRAARVDPLVALRCD